MTDRELTNKFLTGLYRHANRKAKLYDGINSDMAVDTALRYAVEELGEIATDITRERYKSAADECFDLAHTAILIYLALKRLNTE